jgi:SAM-dependent methyltransferase
MIRTHDTVSFGYAQQYAERVWNELTSNLAEVESVNAAIGGLRALRVLDLGAGPGQFTALLHDLGARVVWHDRSMHYREIAIDQLGTRSASVRFELADLLGLDRYADASFDLVWCRVCWFYASSERRLYREILRVLRPGGFVYLRTHHIGRLLRSRRGALVGDLPRNRLLSALRRVSQFYISLGTYALHEAVGVKVGHPFASARRLRRWFTGRGDYNPVFFEVDNTDVCFLGQKRRADR